MLPTIKPIVLFWEVREKWLDILGWLSCLPILKGWRELTDSPQCTTLLDLRETDGVLFGSAAWCSFSLSAVALFLPTKGKCPQCLPEPSPQPLTWLCSAPSWIAMTSREKNTCRSRKQISLICFCFFCFFYYYDDFVVIRWCHSPQSGCPSWEICLSSCGLCWSSRPTCPRSLNVVGHKKKKKVKDPLNCTVVKATKHLRRGLQILQKREREKKKTPGTFCLKTDFDWETRCRRWWSRCVSVWCYCSMKK